jgi:putative endonuclease
MRWYAYVLRNETGRYYYGSTGRSPAVRLTEHNAGRGRWTKARGPWRLVHVEEFPTKTLAQARERFFKSGQGREFLKTLMENVG